MNLKGKSGIYVYTFPNGKKYVGQSLDLQSRLKGYRASVRGTGKDPNRLVILAIRKYGWENVKIEYPFIIDRDKVNETDLSIILDVLELRYIKEYDCVKPNGYNLTRGADSTLFIPCESTEVVLKSINKEQSKPILIYDLEGKFVAEYNSIADCAYQLHITESDVRKYANCRKYMRGMYMVKFKKGDIVPESVIPYTAKYKEIIKTVIKEVEVIKIKEKPKAWKCHMKPILQYDLDGNFIREWESKVSAERFLGGCISLSAKSSNGFQWREKIDNYPLFIENNYKASYVLQYDLDGNFVKEWSLKIEAERYYGKTINYKEAQCFGYQWKKHTPNYPKKITKVSSRTYVRCGKGIIQYTLKGEKISFFKSMTIASRETGISYSRIYGIISGKIKNPDYLWKVAG